MHLIIEKLSIRSFISIIFFLKERKLNSKNVHLRYISNDRFMSLVEQIFPNYYLGSVKEFKFKFDSLIDENGTNLGRKILEGFEGLEEIYELIGLTKFS